MLLLALLQVFTVVEFVSNSVFQDLQKPPKYWCIFPFVGFGTGMLWIYIEANEILNILTALGKRRDSD